MLKYLFVIWMFFVIVGCSQGESRVAEGNRLGILHIGNGAEPSSLDPQVATDVSSAQIMRAIHESLITLNPETLNPEPGIAESWEITEDGKVYTFKIRQDGRWSNGDPITVDDVYWSFSRYLNPALGNPWSYMLFPVVNAERYVSGEIDDFSQVGFEVIDENTFQIRLRNPTPYFLQLIAHSSSAIVPRKVIEEYGSPTARYSQWTRAGNMVGAGPFILERWDISQPIVVRKNPNYWGADRIKLREIWFHPIENGATEERLFRAGQLHISGGIPTDKIPAYEDSNSPVFHSQAYLGTYYYKVNTTRPPFDNVKVRLALAMSIDREAITERVMQRTGSPAYAFVPPGTLGYQPPKTFDYDPEIARQLLAEAGYPDGEGFREFELMYNTSEGHRRIAVAIQQMWKRELNLDVTLANQEWKVFLDTMDNLDFDIARAGWIGDYVDPLTFLDLSTSANGNNNTGFADPVFDRMIYEYVPSAPTEKERLERFYEAEEYLMQRMPIIPLYTYESKYLMAPSVKGVYPNIRKLINYRYVYLEDQ